MELGRLRTQAATARQIWSGPALYGRRGAEPLDPDKARYLLCGKERQEQRDCRFYACPAPIRLRLCCCHLPRRLNWETYHQPYVLRAQLAIQYATESMAHVLPY